MTLTNSLLAFLYPHMKYCPEDVATLVMCHILEQSSVLKEAFTKAISEKLNIPVIPTDEVYYRTQVVGKNKERPDIVAFDKDSQETIICEVKFYAALTENQPNGYLDKIVNSPNTGLIFICPETRKTELWRQLCELVKHRNPVPVGDGQCVSISETKMSIISWGEVLDTLFSVASKAAVEEIDNVKQLRGLCEMIDDQSGFIPFKPEDFGVDVAVSMDRYYKVIDELINKLKAQKEIPASTSTKRATGVWNGYTRYIEVGKVEVGLDFSRAFWKKNDSEKTPFWMWIHPLSKYEEHNDIQARTKNYIEHLDSNLKQKDSNGIIHIALIAPLGATLDEVADSLCKQVITHIKAVAY